MRGLGKLFFKLFIAVMVAPAAVAGTFTGNTTQPFGSFDGIEYVVHRGRFEGTTSLGAFRMPYEIVAPADPAQGVGTLVVEPPHFTLRTVGRDGVLQRPLLFGMGFRHASVGYGLNGFTSLEPFATDLIIAGEPVVPPVSVSIGAGAIRDDEIVVQFAHALTDDPAGVALVGAIERRYSWGVSQTSALLLDVLLSPAGQGLFDLSLLNVTLPNPYFVGSVRPPFVPPAGVGKVMFVETEGDQITGDARWLRAAVGSPDYRLYELAGAPHQPAQQFSTLDWVPVGRALFVRGDQWVRTGTAPPPSTLIDDDTSGAVDPVYGFVTGIARDADLNALGGVRLPDIEVGAAQFIAADFSIGFPITIPGLVGGMVDLSCEPAPDGSVRFENHGDYVSRSTAQVNALRTAGFLLDDDAESLTIRAAESPLGQPSNCP